MSTTAGASETEVLDDDFMQDPHIRYARMRADAPAQRVITTKGLPVWVVVRHAEARKALNDPKVRKDFRRINRILAEKTPQDGDRVEFRSAQPLQANMLNIDPPDHTRLRKLVAKAFTARRVERLRPRVEEITANLLDGIAEESEVDLVDAFAFPLAITVISELLGVDERRRDELRAWFQTIVASSSISNAEAIHTDAVDMATVLGGLIADKRAHPADDLISALIEAGADDERLTEQELISMVFLLLIAGHDTTVNLIANCVFALLGNPEQLAAVRSDPALVPGAIEETLRFESSLNLATLRYTEEPVTFGDVRIPADEIVAVALHSANRDDAKFSDPERFDITRDAGGHLAFGHGIHFCIGAPLARLEGQTAIRHLLERFPELRAAAPLDGLRWRASTLVRGLEQLPVQLR